MLAQVSQGDVVGQVLLDQLAGDGREQHLAAASSVAEAGGAVDVPLTHRLGGSHLSVAMASMIEPDGQVTVRLAEARLICDPRYSGEPTPR